MNETTANAIQFGLDTFGDIPEGKDGQPLSYGDAIRQVTEEAILADQVGVDVIALGEHHRSDFAISSPETVLAGIATRTEHIKLSSGVTVLSSDDPVRVFQRFATLDALSNGRAQVILGRGSFTESSRSSATTSPTTRRSSRRRSSSSRSCSTRSPSRGAAPPAHP